MISPCQVVSLAWSLWQGHGVVHCALEHLQEGKALSFDKV